VVLLIGAVPGADCPDWPLEDWLLELLEDWLPEGVGRCIGAVPGAGLLWAGAGLELWAGFELWAVADVPARSATRVKLARAKVAKRPAQRPAEKTGVRFVKSIFLAWGACAREIFLSCAPKRCVVFKDIPAEVRGVFWSGLCASV
jgi:hypothetical protein